MHKFTYTYTDSYSITLFIYKCKMYNEVHNRLNNAGLGYLTRIVDTFMECCMQIAIN